MPANDALRQRTYAVELLYPEAPALDGAALLAALRERLPEAQALGSGPRGFTFAHPDVPVGEVGGRALPAQTLVALQAPSAARLAPALRQSWRSPEAAALVDGARASLLVSELTGHASLAAGERLALFQRVLDGLVACHPPSAIAWLPAQEIVAGEDYLHGLAQRRYPDGVAGGINVRLFRIEDGRPGETLMDTMGLAVLGLPDLQCHFVGLDPQALAETLMNAALYLLGRGDVIADGDTLAGPQGQPWPCRHAAALAPPDRDVLDVNPGV